MSPHEPRLVYARAVTGAPMNEKRLLNVEELSAYLSLPKPTIYSWVSLRRIPGVVRLGRALRFEKAAVDRWVDAGKVQA